MVSKRAKKEDIYSIVDTSFIPYGSESDNYSILATILDSKIITNTLTNEEIYDLFVICNDITFRICINKEDFQRAAARQKIQRKHMDAREAHFLKNKYYRFLT